MKAYFDHIDGRILGRSITPIPNNINYEFTRQPMDELATEKESVRQAEVYLTRQTTMEKAIHKIPRSILDVQEGENDGSIGDNSMLTRTAQRAMRLRTPNVGLEMDYPSICGRRFASGIGMKIHRTKMGCLNKSFQQKRTAIADIRPRKTKAGLKATVLRKSKLRTKTMNHDSSSTLSVKGSISQQ
ncbi:reverse transcriptase [Elysia marginata]|uniref:Reverse transcriptase n=1 Tax=Elysia marginata TaxID=1093978 RepID=A0AAV4I372_9GAST|nr:reverse transcriptase [Elysia marginata]